MIKTELCSLLGIEYPILQGGMAWVAFAELAAAVSEAGGLGIIGSGQAPPDWLRVEIRKVKERTKRPFGVNLMLESPFTEDNLAVVREERVPVITTGAGNPGKYIKELKELGIKVIPVVASVALAQRLTRVGVDAVIAEGMESGGHVGEMTTMALLPQVVDAVDLPVIAAGGIADGRGFAAALALGAVGIQMGTRFLASKESPAHSRVKEMLLKARDRDTVVTGRATGHPVRVLFNKLARQFDEMERHCAPVEEMEKLGAGRLRAAMVEGDVEYGSVMAGQVAGMINSLESVADILAAVTAGAEETLARTAELGRVKA